MAYFRIFGYTLLFYNLFFYFCRKLFYMLSKIKSLLMLLSPLPMWLRHLIAALIGAIGAVLLSMNLISCGTPKTVATVSNVNPNSTVTVTMSVSNSTSSTPSVETSIPLNHER